MNHYRAGLLNPDSTLERELNQPGVLALDLQSANSIEQLTSVVRKGGVDVVLIYETPGKPVFELLDQLRKATPNIPAVLLLHPASGTWGTALNDLCTELVSCPVHGLELKHRIARLLSQTHKTAASAPIGKSLTSAVWELRNPNSGKLDASMIAEAYGLSEADIARGIKRRPQTINATPDADSLQKLLHPYERLAAAIKYTAGELQPALKIWLQSPNPTTPNTSPIELVKQGHINELADLWDDVMLGQPD
jgi:DNA-binding NarL/FixJ family response regulator